MKKEKMPTFGTENVLFPYFWDRIFKKLLSYLKSSHSNQGNSKIYWKKEKCLNLEAKSNYLDIFGIEFWKTIVIFEVSILKYVKLKKFAKKQKCLNYGPKMPYFGIFGQYFKKSILILKIGILKFV